MFNQSASSFYSHAIPLGFTRVRHFEVVRLRLGEGWGEGLKSLDRVRTPSPQPSPQGGEGAHRDRGAVMHSHNQSPFPYQRNVLLGTFNLAPGRADPDINLTRGDARGHHCGVQLVSQFRSSHHCAAPSFANFGIEGH